MFLLIWLAPPFDRIYNGIKELKKQLFKGTKLTPELTFKLGIGWIFKGSKISLHQLDALLVYQIWKERPRTCFESFWKRKMVKIQRGSCLICSRKNIPVLASAKFLLFRIMLNSNEKRKQRKETAMPKKIRCVCSVINQLGLRYGPLEGEIYFKHSARCKHKITGTFAWTGAGYQKKGEPM